MSNLINSDMRVGFTGTHKGMTTEQEVTVTNLLALRPAEFHHGDCVGCDTEAHALAFRAGIRIIGHPPEQSKSRSFCTFDEIRKEKPYLERNHDIVDETDILIACPEGTKEIMRSGTWATVRYAEKVGKTILLIYPSGRIFKCSPGFGRRSQ